MSIIQQNEKTEPQGLLDMPIAELAKICVDPAILLAALSIAYQQGYKAAQEQCHRYYHTMFTGQNEISITN